MGVESIRGIAFLERSVPSKFHARNFVSQCCQSQVSSKRSDKPQGSEEKREKRRVKSEVEVEKILIEFSG